MVSYEGAGYYSWARRVPPAYEEQLSDRARDGLQVARELAENAVERRVGRLKGCPPDDLPYKLTLSDADSPWSEPRLLEFLDLACWELFHATATLNKRSSIQRQLARHDELGDRYCLVKDCGALLPLWARRSRTRCDSCQAKDRRVEGTAAHP